MLRPAIVFGGFPACAAIFAMACGGGDDSSASTSGGDGGTGSDATSSDGSSKGDGAGTSADGGLPSGWLYTSGNKIFVSSGGGTDAQWMARGVNTDDLFLCGYNNTLAMTGPERSRNPRHRNHAFNSRLEAHVHSRFAQHEQLHAANMDP